MRWEKEMLYSKFELLGVCHSNFVSKVNQSFSEDRVYTSYSLPLLAPLSLPSFPLATIEIPYSSI
jgi:hypothetical protein